MKIAVGCDPNASGMKGKIVAMLEAEGHTVGDLGGDDPIYANTARAVAAAVAGGEYERGLLFCGTGLGMALAANKVPGAYAVVCSDPYSVERSILSNNANILALGSLVHGVEIAKRVVLHWLSLRYAEGGPSQVKVEGIRNVEKEYIKDR